MRHRLRQERLRAGGRLRLLRRAGSTAGPVLLLAQPGADGRPQITTLEGVEEDRAACSAMRSREKAACSADSAFRASWCAPLVAGQQGKTEDREEVAQALVGHICRCTGYARILDAIQTAGEAWKNEQEMPWARLAAITISASSTDATRTSI